MEGAIGGIDVAPSAEGQIGAGMRKVRQLSLDACLSQDGRRVAEFLNRHRTVATEMKGK